MLPKLLQDGLWGIQRRYEKFKIDSAETQEYIDEIDFLIQRTLHHPTMLKFENVAGEVRKEYEDLAKGKTPMTAGAHDSQVDEH
jgi:hypothetical protein